MRKFETQIRVRYSETDKMGFVYYGNFTSYYEVGRVEALREIGLSYRAIEEDYRVMMPVIHSEIRYFRAAKYDDLLNVQTSVDHCDADEIVFITEIYGPSGKLLNRGSITLWYIDSVTKKRIALPENLKEKLLPTFGKVKDDN